MSTSDRKRAEELLHIANTATAANHDGENPEAALLIAEAQVHATLAVAQALEPAEWAEPAKPTGEPTVWAYRVVIDHDPARESSFHLPLHQIPHHFWLQYAFKVDPKDYPKWIPQDLYTRVMTVQFIVDRVPFRDVEADVYGLSDAEDTVRKLGEWGVRAHIERAPINTEWEAIA
jgi:hypothetical protein